MFRGHAKWRKGCFRRGCFFEPLETRTFLSGGPDATAPGQVALSAASDSGQFNDDRITNLNNSSGKTLDFVVTSTIPGATITLFSDGKLIGSTVAVNDTTLVTTNGTTVLANGSRSITARQTIDGVTSVDSPTLSITIDTVAPSKSSALNLVTSSDTGISNSDGITSDSTPGFYVSLLFRFYRDGVQISDDYQSGNEYYNEHYVLPFQKDDTYTYSIVNVDVAGNTSAETSRVVTIDTSAPNPPTAPDLRASYDSGQSDDDNITNKTRPVLDVGSDDGGVMHMVFDGIDRERIISSPGTQSWIETAPIAFEKMVNVSTLAAPYSVTVADVNYDGTLDLVSVVSLPQQIVVNLGNGDGTFGAALATLNPSGATGIAVADFDEDGNADVVTANITNGLNIFWGNGDGTFISGPTIDLGVGAVAYYPATTDLDGDGNADIVVGAEGINKVAVIHGNGNGTFQPVVLYSVPQKPTRATLADVNLDGRTDIVLSLPSVTAFCVYLQNADGTFQTPKSRGTRSYATDVAIGDFDNDGLPDAMVTERSVNKAEFLKGKGDGTFLPGVQLATGINSDAAFAADFNLDGNLDFVLTARVGDFEGIDVLFGNGDGTFLPYVGFTAGTNAFDLQIADLNNDGQMDAVIADYSERTIHPLIARSGALSDGPHSAFAWMEDLAGNASARSTTLEIIVDTKAPTIVAGSPQFNYQTAPQNLIWQFSEPVDGVTPQAFSLKAISPAAEIPFELSLGRFPSTATLAWPTLNGKGVLSDGNYRASILPGITDLAGNALSPSSFEFFHLSGDANHDRVVDLRDLVIVATHWQMTGAMFSDGDFNYDGIVGPGDLRVLGMQWQTRLDAHLPPPLNPLTRPAARTPTRIATQIL